MGVKQFPELLEKEIQKVMHEEGINYIDAIIRLLWKGVVAYKQQKADAGIYGKPSVKVG